MKLDRRIFVLVLILLLIMLVSFVVKYLFESEEYQEVTINDLLSHPMDLLGMKTKTSGVVKYYNATGRLDFIAGDFFIRLPSGIIGIPVFVAEKQQLPLEGSFVEVFGNLRLALGVPGDNLYFNADSWHYIPTFYEYIKETAYVMMPLIVFFLVFLVARSFGGLLGYLHISHRKHVE